MTGAGSSPARPPLVRRLAYRFFGVRVPYAYRYWVRDDVLRRWYLTRHFACNLAVVALFQVVVMLGISLVFLVWEGEYEYFGPHTPVWLFYPAALGLSALLEFLFPRLGGRARRVVLRRHDFHEDGTSVVHPLPGSFPGRAGLRAEGGGNEPFGLR